MDEGGKCEGRKKVRRGGEGEKWESGLGKESKSSCMMENSIETLQKVM